MTTLTTDALLRPNSAEKLFAETRNSWIMSTFGLTAARPAVNWSLLSVPSSRKLLARLRWPFMNAELPPAVPPSTTLPGLLDGAGLQLHQLEHVAAVQRQLADALLVDEVRDAAFFGVDERPLALHRHRFGERADFQGEVEAHGVADGEQHARTGRSS